MTRIGDGFQNPRIGQFGPGGDQDYQTTLVQPGETALSQVAQRLKMLLDLLQQFNPQIREPNRLQTGQEVYYPKTTSPFTAMAQADSKPAAPVEHKRRSLENRMESTLARQQLGGAQQETAAPKSLFPTYDPMRGPQIGAGEWTDAMLNAPDITSEQLKNFWDPQAFLMARVANIQKPTPAVTISKVDGTRFPMNPGQMSSKEDADAMLKRLQAMGFQGEVKEVPPDNIFVRSDYGDDPRRNYMLGEFNVGILLDRYARYPKEVADQMTQAEINQMRAG